MEWLNYHHLYYFWVVARAGSIVAATKQLRLAQPTISSQIRSLERNLGEQLFQRVGRSLVMTEVGEMVFGYAEEIFGLGKEMVDAVKRRLSGRPVRLVAGISHGFPRMLVHRLLHPSLGLAEPVQLVCHGGRLDRLVVDLSLHRLDLVLADGPLAPAVKVKAYNHLLGECGVALYAAPPLAAELADDFPASLDGAAFLLPADGTMLRAELEAWFEEVGVKPLVVGEFDDSSLLKVFGQCGAGVFAMPTVLGDEILSQYQIATLGATDATVRYFAISVERQLKHPAAVSIAAEAERIFGEPG